MAKFNVGPGEKRFNEGIYKSSHNSFSRDESLASQIDDYNVWQIELDIFDYQGDFKVTHNCDPASLDAADTLPFLLNKMVLESTTFKYRFTMIYLDLKGNGLEGCLYDWGENINIRLKNVFMETLGGDQVYHSHTFINEDASSWPSWQNLVRRGFHWCIVIDWHGIRPANADLDDLFFEATSTNQPDMETAANRNMVLVCIDGGCDANPTNEPPGLTNERWIYRTYPGGGCFGDCTQQNGNYWQNGISKSYTLVATNCLNWDHTFYWPTHSPSPLFVNGTAEVKCPMDYSECEWGTRAYPFHRLEDAIHRASPMVILFIEAGEYPIRVPGASYTIRQPIILRAINGTVRIH